MISSEHAHLLISKYRSEQTRLRINFILADKTINIRLTATALAAETGFGGVSFVVPNGDFCLTLLSECRFEYSDARELEDREIRERAESTFAGCLEIIFPSGERLVILELR
jgi:hypothetical protein